MTSYNYQMWVNQNCGEEVAAALRRLAPNAAFLTAPNGARVNSQNAYDFHEPPTDPAEREQLILDYKRALLAEKESELAKCRVRFFAEYGRDLTNCSPAEIDRVRGLDNQTVTYLKQLKLTLQTLHQEIPALENSLAHCAAEAKRKAEAQRAAESKARHAQYIAEQEAKATV